MKLIHCVYSRPPAKLLNWQLTDELTIAVQTEIQRH